MLRAVALVALVFVAGCAVPGAERSGEWGAPIDAPAPPALPEGVEVADATLVARDATSATFVWKTTLDAGEIALPGAPFSVGAASGTSTTVRLPEGGPYLADVRVTWKGNAMLGAYILRDDLVLCASWIHEAGASAPVVGEKTCRAWEDAAGAREWTISIEREGGSQEAVDVEAEVRIATTPTPARYDVSVGPSTPQGLGASEPGASATSALEYDLGALLVDDPVTKRPYPVRVLGVVHFPEEGDGPFPVVVFLHGRHSSCEGPARALLFSHCRGVGPAASSVLSYHGYDDVAALLASHGYVVVSIDANDVNAMDSPSLARGPGVGNVPARGDDGLVARSRLILRTLDEFAAIDAAGGGPRQPALDALQGRLDLDRIGLMGHSRGAEAVTRVPSFAEESGHWSAEAIRAVYSLAGTTRFRLPDYEPPLVRAPVAYASVIPYCDGDVFTLGNADFHDLFLALPDHGELTQLVFMGANHNAYNAAWTDDDATTWQGDPYCAPEDAGAGYGRLSPSDQLAHQRDYLAAFFRLHLGDEEEFAPLFTGEATPPASSCPDGLAACPGLVRVSHAPASPDALVVDAMASAASLEANAWGGATTLAGFAKSAWCAPAQSEPGDACAMPRAVGLAGRLRLAWDEDATWRTAIPKGKADLSGFNTLTLRLAADFDDALPGERLLRARVVLEDASGARVAREIGGPSGPLFTPPGFAARHIVLHDARLPLADFPGIDLATLRAIELQLDGATPGVIQLGSVSFARSAGAAERAVPNR